MKQSQISNNILRSSKRFMQTVQTKQSSVPLPPSSFKHSEAPKIASSRINILSENTSNTDQSKKWATYALPRHSAKPMSFSPVLNPTATLDTTASIPFKLNKPAKPFSFNKPSPAPSPFKTKDVSTPSSQPIPSKSPSITSTSTTPPKAEAEAPVKKPRRKLRPRKAAITLSPAAVEHLQNLLDQPNPQMIRIGVRNRGCSGLTYHLEYVDKPQQFDEEILQDGVKVLIDSKALFSIIGSEMDWVDDKLSTRFVFRNPNVKGECGCGESFMV